MSEKIPLIIAASNEEAFIRRALSKLDHNSVEPIVAVNGSVDATANIARSFGVTVFEQEVRGKLPAIQTALKGLGSRALDPVLYMDADCYPKNTRWAHSMVAHLSEKTPGIVAGGIQFTDKSFIGDTLRSMRRRKELLKAHLDGSVQAVYGANMATRFQDEEILSAILALPHVWPGEDKAIAHEAILRGASLNYATEQNATIITSSRYYPSLCYRVVRGAAAASVLANQQYHERAPEGVEFEFINSSYVPVST